MPLPKIYNPAEVEDTMYQLWEHSGYFNPDMAKQAKKSFTIAMPPPNATGTLHIGHALGLTLQDLMIRYHRMKGEKALWVPGTDHASIATQNKVEKALLKDGISRKDISHEAFLGRIIAYVEESRGTIRNQIRKMGSSCDWSRERYTLDEGLSQAVSKIFVSLYDDGLIYRGYRIVNWCPRCRSTLSDDEVKYTTEKTPFYYFKYGPVIIGTVRPETKFLDKTIVVNPKDPRYKDLVGQEIEIEWIDGKIHANVIADPATDMNFGTGAMTITPAHSFEDFELAQKYHLPIVKIIDEEGNFTAAARGYEGKNARASRQQIVEVLRSKGLLDHIDENYVHNLSICYRCSTPLEPLPSMQWFVSVETKIKKLGKTFKEVLLEAVDSKEISLVPKRFEKIYFHWINNLRDWCISRQIVFGHRLPVYYCPNQPKGCGHITVSLEAPLTCPRCSVGNPAQDTDTLDTWFSSGLWTFSTLGWPSTAAGKGKKIKKKGDLSTFHPTSVLETGYDILFFWVARMIMMSYYALSEPPFKTVYLHGLVLDVHGKKMSKSKEETQINPLDMIERYGTDALRVSMLVGVTPGNDVRLGEQKIESYRNFVNKLWNISRFILSFSYDEGHAPAHHSMSVADQWITSRLHKTIARVTTLIEKYRFSQAAEELRIFTWDELADWYLEVAKIEKKPRAFLLHLLQQVISLWHPFTPFVTEVLYQHIRSLHSAHDKEKMPSLLMIAPWPTAQKKLHNPRSERAFTIIQELVKVIRAIRLENNISPSQKIQALFYTRTHGELIQSHEETLKTLARLDLITIFEGGERPKNALYGKVDEVELYLPLGMMKVEEERARLAKETEKLKGFMASVNEKLSNTEFSARAPKHIVDKEKQKLLEYQTHLKKIEEQMAKLS